MGLMPTDAVHACYAYLDSELRRRGYVEHHYQFKSGVEGSYARGDSAVDVIQLPGQPGTDKVIENAVFRATTPRIVLRFSRKTFVGAVRTPDTPPGSIQLGSERVFASGMEAVQWFLQELK